MSLNGLLVSLFLGYGFFLFLFGGYFFAPEMATTILCVAGISTIMGVLLYTRRCYVLNFMIAVYVATKYLLMPWVPFLYESLNSVQLSHMHALLHYYDAATSARVYGYVLLCLAAWFIGLMTITGDSPGRQRTVPREIPAFFRAVDSMLARPTFGFWTVYGTLFLLNLRHLVTDGSGAAATAQSEGALLFGLLTTSFITLAALFMYLFSTITGKTARNAWLVLPTALTAGMSLFSGSRGALYVFMLLATFYIVALKGPAFRMKGRYLLIVAVVVPIVVLFGVIGQELKPLWRTGVPPSLMFQVVFDSVMDGRLGEKLPFTLTIIIARLADTLGQFYIVTDSHTYDPWSYVNPLQVMMRIVNDIVPGDVFSGVMTVNQIFDWVYLGNTVVYNSEFWGLVGMSYVYFGYYVAPLVFMVLAFLVSRFAYPTLLSLSRQSPSFAALMVVIAWDLLEFGVLERIVAHDTVRMFISGVIFVVLARLLDKVIASVRVGRQGLAAEG